MVPVSAVRSVPAIAASPSLNDLERRILDDAQTDLEDEVEAFRRRSRIRGGSISVLYLIDPETGRLRAYRMSIERGR